jgi:YD repeat-containing protein
MTSAANGVDYDLAGNRLTLTADSSLFLSYFYDDNSRLSSLTQGTSAFGLGYDEANRRTSLSYPNGVSTSYAYDTMSRLTSLAAQKAGTPITGFSYSYDDAGNRTTRSGLDFAESYSYDPLNRLSQVVRDSVTSEQYDYDKAGNRLMDIAHSDWSYNERNELSSFD